MNNQEIFNEVKAIFGRMISDKTEVRPETASRDVHNWDSLNHVMFIAEIEKTFGIRFDLTDMLEMSTIADICKGVESQLKSK
jgi:acyl carrier protein